MSEPTGSIQDTDTSTPHDHSDNLPRKLNGGSHPALQHNPSPGPVLLVDSDTSRDAAGQYLPHGWTVETCDPSLTSAHTYLGHSHAVIWGRNDEGGRTWADAVADVVGIPCAAVALARLPRHWHLDQPLPEPRTPQQVTSYLQAALGRCVAHVPAARAPAPPSVAAPTLPVAPQWVATGAGGSIKPLIANVAELLRTSRAQWNLRYDQFSNRPFLGNDALTDRDMREIVCWVQGNGILAGKAITEEAILRVADMYPFHPVKQYLESVTWDGIDRLDHFLTDHGGAEADEWGLTAAMGRKWMIQAVARIYEPGCQADAMLILEGAQGMRKSTLFRELFGDRWFTDHLPNLADKDSMLQLCGVWCVEVSELATLDRSDSAKIKQFLTSRIDRFRAPFGRLVADNPRTSVFGGTINPGAEGYLKDPTGGRRFWPVQITEMANVAAIASSRDQLWAEARHRYQAGEKWWIDDADAELYTAVTQRQRDRYEDDPWADAIENFVRGKAMVSAADIFRTALNLTTTADWSRGEQMRVGRVMTALSWTRKRIRTAPHKLEWRYIPLRGLMQDATREADDDQPRMDV